MITLILRRQSPQHVYSNIFLHPCRLLGRTLLSSAGMPALPGPNSPPFRKPRWVSTVELRSQSLIAGCEICERLTPTLAKSIQEFALKKKFFLFFHIPVYSSSPVVSIRACDSEQCHEKDRGHHQTFQT